MACKCPPWLNGKGDEPQCYGDKLIQVIGAHFPLQLPIRVTKWRTAPMLQSSTHLTGEHTWVITGEHIWVITGDWAHQSHHRWFSTPELSQVSTHESSQVIEHTWVITADWEHLSHHRWAHLSPHRWLSTPGSSQVSTPESWNRGMHNCKFKTKPHCHMI